MKHDPVFSGTRKPVNLSIDTGVAATGRELGLNLSRISETAIREATRIEQARRWEAENREALDGWRRWVEKNGLPLARYRLF